MHNEADNVAAIHKSLSHQSCQDFDWVTVDDGSTDGTGQALRSLTGGSLPTVLERQNGGGLIGGSAYGAWRFGVQWALDSHPSRYTHVMKLDADVLLRPDYLRSVLASMTDGIAIAGGVIGSRGMREQVHHVPGPVKLYTLAAYRLLGELPSAIGFDVMDEVAVQAKGMRVQVLRTASFKLARAIGASEGGVHGRYRNGRVCRWTGYDPLYFVLHALRYAGRKPYAVGSVAMCIGYLRAGPGPYPAALKNAHKAIQRAKLRAAIRSPLRWVRSTYGY